MTIDKPPRAPTLPQRWMELDALAQRYLALPAGDSPAREQLRQRILRLLAAGWVQLTSDGDVPRSDDVLSRTFREQAAKLSRRHGNNRLAQAYGGLDNLSDESKAEFLARRASKAGRQQQTLLTGMLSQWNPARGDLRLFMQLAVRSFLLDLYDKCYGRQDTLSGAPGATPRGFLTDSRSADTPGADDAGPEAGPGDWLDAMARQSGIGDPPDLESAAQTEELFACLEQARDALPPGRRAVYDSEIRRFSQARFSDQAQAASLGLGSRNTLYKRREELNAALRRLLAAAGHAGLPG